MKEQFPSFWLIDEQDDISGTGKVLEVSPAPDDRVRISIRREYFDALALIAAEKDLTIGRAAEAAIALYQLTSTEEGMRAKYYLNESKALPPTIHW